MGAHGSLYREKQAGTIQLRFYSSRTDEFQYMECNSLVYERALGLATKDDCLYSFVLPGVVSICEDVIFSIV
jgi:hypothetical protein